MKSRRVLLVDDEQHIADVVVYVLEQAGYEVLTAPDGDRALALFDEVRPDAVILDLNLPGISGLDLFNEMRRRRAEAPIIMLTSRSEEIDRVVGLEMGADDYVTKPFSPRELAARVRAVLRRCAAPRPSGEAAELRHGPLLIDTLGYAVHYFGERVPLTRSEYRLVECLTRYPARVFTRDMLISAMYDDEAVVTDRSVDAYIKRVRRKFAAIRADVNPFETVHGLGYKLHGELEGLA